MTKLFYGDIVKVKPNTIDLVCPCTVMSSKIIDGVQHVKIKDNYGESHDTWYMADIFVTYSQDELKTVILDKCYQVINLMLLGSNRTVTKYEAGSGMRPDEDGDMYEETWNAGVCMSDGDYGFTVELEEDGLCVSLVNYGQIWYNYRFELDEWTDAIIKGFSEYLG